MMKPPWFGLLGFFPSLWITKFTLYSSMTTQLLDISEQTGKLLLTKEVTYQFPARSLAFVKLFNELGILFGAQNAKTSFKLKCVCFFFNVHKIFIIPTIKRWNLIPLPLNVGKT